jgi:hypothetical protein
MSTIDVSKLLVTSTRENILAKIIVMGTGQPVKPADMNALLQIFDMHGHYGGIAELLTGFMAQKYAANGHDLASTVSEIMSNATGLAWTTTDAADFIAKAPQLGIYSWPTLFEYMIMNHKSGFGAVLDINVRNYLQAYGIEPLPKETTVLPPAIQEQFVTPKGNDYFATVGVRDYDNKLYGEFYFDAPSMFREGNVNIIDFAGGDKALAVTAFEFERMFGFSKDTFFLNFSEGDKVVIINETRLYPFLGMNTDKPKFDYSQLSSKPDDPYKSPYDPSTGVNEGDSLVRVTQPPQPEGPLLAFHTRGLPPQLSFLALDSYRLFLEGFQYDLNLSHKDIFPEGNVTVVGANSALFGPDNFLFNDPAYLI